MKICLVCSAGGHFYELHSLNSVWRGHSRFWVTFNKEDTQYLLQGEKKYWAFAPTNRNPKNFIRNFFLAAKILVKEKPDAIVSTGAGVAVPFFYFGWLTRRRTIYIESMTRVTNLSLTGRLVYPVARHFLVQWPELAELYPRARFKGQVL